MGILLHQSGWYNPEDATKHDPLIKSSERNFFT